MGILLALALVLPLTTIFLFKRRMLQFRLGVVEMILLLGAQIVMGIYYFLSYRLFSSFMNSTPRASNCHWCCRSSP